MLSFRTMMGGFSVNCCWAWLDRKRLSLGRWFELFGNLRFRNFVWARAKTLARANFGGGQRPFLFWPSPTLSVLVHGPSFHQPSPLSRVELKIVFPLPASINLRAHRWTRELPRQETTRKSRGHKKLCRTRQNKILFANP